jgi:hydroxymethylbilane synthase
MHVEEQRTSMFPEHHPAPPLRLGTRGSALALRQTELVRALLRHAQPTIETRLEVIQSLGDRACDRPLAALGAQGIFTHALEQALRDDAIDVAVHSAKDMPSRLTEGFALAATPAREDPRDCLVTHDGRTLDELPRGARIGTGSPRRAAQLLALRPDLQIEAMRGNVDTRRRAALERRFDGVILAAAGLQRLGLLDEHARPLSVDQCLPQAGQGILALETRAEDREAIAFARTIHDAAAGACLAAERAVLAGLAAGCQAPVAAYARIADGALTVRGLVAAPSAGASLAAVRCGAPDEAEHLGMAVADELRTRGADAVLRRAREGER